MIEGGLADRCCRKADSSTQLHRHLFSPLSQDSSYTKAFRFTNSCWFGSQSMSSGSMGLEQGRVMPVQYCSMLLKIHFLIPEVP